MSKFALVILVIVGVAAVFGFRKGLVRQIGSLVAIVAAIVVCRVFGDAAADMFSSGVQEPGRAVMLSVFGYVALFAVAYAAVRGVAYVLRGIIKGVHLSVIDSLGGAMFMVLKWLFVASLAYNLLVAVIGRDDDAAEPDIWAERLLDFAPAVMGTETAHEIYDGLTRVVTGHPSHR